MRKAFLAVLILLLPFWIAADGFVVDHYAVIIEADSSRTLHVQEDIMLEYTSPAHGFIRDIQHRFGTASADIDLLWASSPASVSDDGTFLSVPTAIGTMMSSITISSRLMHGLPG